MISMLNTKWWLTAQNGTLWLAATRQRIHNKSTTFSSLYMSRCCGFFVGLRFVVQLVVHLVVQQIHNISVWWSLGFGFAGTYRWVYYWWMSVIRLFFRLELMRQNTVKYRKGTFEGGMSEMSYTLETIERRSFYTYILANLNGMCVIRPKWNLPVGRLPLIVRGLRGVLCAIRCPLILTLDPGSAPLGK